MSKYSIGLDFGSLSVRAILLDIETGEEKGVSVYEYPHGIMTNCVHGGKKIPVGGALQHPQDYLDGMCSTVTDIMRSSGVSPDSIVGIGVDFTASTMLPVRSDGYPLCCMKEFQGEPHAYVKLWKHHGAESEAEEVNKKIKEYGEEWISCYGGRISSEMFLPKALETLHKAPEVYEAADRFVEAMDWVVWQLTGKETRSRNGLSYKAFYNEITGRPSHAFLKSLDPKLEYFYEEKVEAPTTGIGEKAGVLCEQMAKRLGLIPGIPVGTGMVDALAGVIGGGVYGPEEMMIIVGTSYCHILMSEERKAVNGLLSLVKDGILPGYYVYEASQCGGGDHFAWATKTCAPEEYMVEAREKGIGIHQLIAEKLADYEVGQSGLIALDWFNGVRTPYMDSGLSGMILGLTLQTKPEEIYMALMEATGFGTRTIVETLEEGGMKIGSILLSGGIPLKNPMLVQMYANILNREICVCKTAQAGAVGAAMLGIAAAPKEITGYDNLEEIAKKLGQRGDKIYRPEAPKVADYDKLYQEYKILQKYFGEGTNDVMKRLNRIKRNEE